MVPDGLGGTSVCDVVRERQDVQRGKDVRMRNCGQLEHHSIVLHPVSSLYLADIVKMPNQHNVQHNVQTVTVNIADPPKRKRKPRKKNSALEQALADLPATSYAQPAPTAIPLGQPTNVHFSNEGRTSPSFADVAAANAASAQRTARTHIASALADARTAADAMVPGLRRAGLDAAADAMLSHISETESVLDGVSGHGAPSELPGGAPSPPISVHSSAHSVPVPPAPPAPRW